MLSNRALIAQASLMAPWSGIDDDYVFLNSGPLFHIGTFMPNLSTFVAGGTNVFVRRSEGDVLCAAIDARALHGRVRDRPDGRRDRRRQRRRSLRPLVVPRAAAATRSSTRWCSPTVPTWGRRAGGYGQSEVMGMATFNLLAPDAIGTHGRPSPLVQLRVVGPDDDELPAGEVGEIIVRGLTVMNGYWNRPTS